MGFCPRVSFYAGVYSQNRILQQGPQHLIHGLGFLNSQWYVLQFSHFVLGRFSVQKMACTTVLVHTAYASALAHPSIAPPSQCSRHSRTNPCTDTGACKQGCDGGVHERVLTSTAASVSRHPTLISHHGPAATVHDIRGHRPTQRGASSGVPTVAPRATASASVDGGERAQNGVVDAVPFRCSAAHFRHFRESHHGAGSAGGRRDYGHHDAAEGHYDGAEGAVCAGPVLCGVARAVLLSAFRAVAAAPQRRRVGQPGQCG
ncbi:hypothetical protein DFJ77DRAFT_481082 [Powellomyces hirtus]|nr:hypothetical protein DFJ77DRAFT_481082 [Powellomyces hirtus]